MFVRMIVGVAVVASLLVACSSNEGDSNEGNSCSSGNDCGADLSCQPITGRQSNYCCPTPASASTKSNCQSVQ